MSTYSGAEYLHQDVNTTVRHFTEWYKKHVNLTSVHCTAPYKYINYKNKQDNFITGDISTSFGVQ